MSELTAAVQKALVAEHPHLVVSVDEETVDGATHLAIVGVDYQLGGPDLTALCIDVYTRARAASDLPVAVSVQGEDDAGCRLDTELDNLSEYIADEYGVDAVVVFAWGHEGPESGELEVVTEDPIQAAILGAMLNRGPSSKHH